MCLRPLTVDKKKIRQIFFMISGDKKTRAWVNPKHKEDDDLGLAYDNEGDLKLSSEELRQAVANGEEVKKSTKI